jgi:hypothetical protein
LTSCDTTGSTSEILKNPAVQGSITLLEQFALDQLNQKIFNAPKTAARGKTQSEEVKVQQVIMAAQAKFPNESRATIEKVVRKKHAELKASDSSP